mmetsp:Transcript_72137/g.192816  ORF Transcript_72137/g.192816 Transcript_72137/m.192816 type:complete len:201 (-) Transcript_72137:110-712(-)
MCSSHVVFSCRPGFVSPLHRFFLLLLDNIVELFCLNLLTSSDGSACFCCLWVGRETVPRRAQEEGVLPEQADARVRIDLRMIDFAHVFEADDHKLDKDRSYCSGLLNLQTALRGIAEGIDPAKIELVDHRAAEERPVVAERSDLKPVPLASWEDLSCFVEPYSLADLPPGDITPSPREPLAPVPHAEAKPAPAPPQVAPR